MATVFVAYANGANDNFKGVATLFGSRAADYQKALKWATLTTLAGSIASLFVAQNLLNNFTGSGLLPERLAGTPAFLLSVAASTGLTVILATRLGLPVSTTHALTGGLAGAGLAAAGTEFHLAFLGRSFLIPLLFSPVLAASLASVAYVLFRSLRLRLGVTEEQCLCIGETGASGRPSADGVSAAALSVDATAALEARIDTTENCEMTYTRRLWGIPCQQALEWAHYGSAGLVCFARGLNDTPKILALLAFSSLLDVHWSLMTLALAMAAGGLLQSREVAQTMSFRITPLNPGQGFTANLVTALLVAAASVCGLPVSTTHVSVGSLFGIGLILGRLQHRVATQIVAAWVLTLPMSAVLAATLYALLAHLS